MLENTFVTTMLVCGFFQLLPELLRLSRCSQLCRKSCIYHFYLCHSNKNAVGIFERKFSLDFKTPYTSNPLHFVWRNSLESSFRTNGAHRSLIAVLEVQPKHPGGAEVRHAQETAAAAAAAEAETKLLKQRLRRGQSAATRKRHRTEPKPVGSHHWMSLCVATPISGLVE